MNLLIEDSHLQFAKTKSLFGGDCEVYRALEVKELA